jgi:TIR domain
MPEQIFVSYSRNDDRWRRIFQKAMGTGIFARSFKLWFDDRIKANDNWNDEIKANIVSSRFAVLLVSLDFLRSNFIVNQELPSILKRRRVDGRVFWVPIKKVPDDLLQKAELGPIQAVWSPRKPLDTLNKKQLEDALTAIASELIRQIDLPTNRAQDVFRSKVEEVVGDDGVVLGDPFAAGTYSIFYRAKRRNADVAVKAVIPLPNHAWLSDDFVRRANVVKEISNSTAITIDQVFPDPRAPCVVMDYVNAPTLRARLQKEGKLPPNLVADILAQLLRLAGHLHVVSGQPILGPVEPSHVYYDSAKNKAFVSLLSIAYETLESCRRYPARLHDSTALPYLSPERYYGKPFDARTDQYYLGLLGLELLNGKLPVPIQIFADLETKVQFFKAPRSFFDPNFCLNEPAFSFVLARMLEIDEKNRWTDTSDLVVSLQELAKGDIPNPIKQYTYDQYVDTLNNNNFFSSFYTILIANSKEIEKLFEKIPMDAQYDKLAEALSSIFDFTLKRTAGFAKHVKKHRALRPEYFLLFQEAFLAALLKVKITDGYSHYAWRAILKPALAFMEQQVVGAQK